MIECFGFGWEVYPTLLDLSETKNICGEVDNAKIWHSSLQIIRSLEREAHSSSLSNPEVETEEIGEDQLVEQPAAIASNQALKEKIRALQKSNWILRKDKETLRHQLSIVSDRNDFVVARADKKRFE